MAALIRSRPRFVLAFALAFTAAGPGPAWAQGPAGAAQDPRSQSDPTTEAKHRLVDAERLYWSAFLAARPAPEVDAANIVLDADGVGTLTQFLYAAAFRDPTDEALGATLEPPSESLRTQLDLPKDQGLVVASLAGDGPAAQAGLKEKDILLKLGGKALGKGEDVQTLLKAAGDKEVSLEILRAGKRTVLSVQPVYRVTIGPVNKEKVDYFIGVPVGAVDDTLRSHLDVPPDTGLVVNEVTADSPAEKAGVKPNDILLTLGDKPLTSTEVLVAQIQATKDSTTALKLIRGGKVLTLPITPAKRVTKAAVQNASRTYRLWTTVPYHIPLEPQNAHGSFVPTKVPDASWTNHALALRPASAEATPTAKSIDAIDAELKALRKAVEELRDALKKTKE